MAERGPGPDPSSEVRGEDWAGRQLDGVTVSHVLHQDVDMSEVRTSRAVFDGCTFRDVRLTASEHVSTAFTNCRFVACDLSGARFTGCKLVGSTFERCRTRRLVADGGDWSFVGLVGADLRDSRFDALRLREADLTGARFDGAQLTRADLSGAWLHRTRWPGCDLRGSDLSALDPTECDVRGAVIDAQQAVALVTALGAEVREQE